MTEVTLVLLATGRYREFVPGVIDSAQKHIRQLDHVALLSDDPPVGLGGVDWLPWGHFKWPLPTLLRYHAISCYADHLRESDFLLYLDVDMRVVADIELPATPGTLATMHPGFANSAREAFSYENRPASTSYVGPAEGTRYFCGGVQGGSTGAYLKAARIISHRIDKDLAHGIVPVWHDESAWNRYCIDIAPATVWDSMFCTPEDEITADAKILALMKDHDAYRGTNRRVKVGRYFSRRSAKARRSARSVRESFRSGS